MSHAKIKKTEWHSVSVPKHLMDMVEKLWRAVGCASPAEYVRGALRTQIEKDQERLE